MSALSEDAYCYVLSSELCEKLTMQILSFSMEIIFE